MGGLRSGGASSGRNTVEGSRSLDVLKLHRAGCLEPGWAGIWQWTRDGERVAWIQMRAEESRVVLSYRWRLHDGEWEDVEEPVRIVWQPCRFGGQRPYFVCPGVVNGVACCRRVIKIYGAGTYFVCRHCYRLAYMSPSEGPLDRLLRRANKIRMRLGGEPGMAARFPDRPRGMHLATYERLWREVFEVEMEADERMDAVIARMMARDE